MDTTDAPPPQDPPASHAGGWWRQPMADLLDVLLVSLVGLLVGGVLAGLFLAGSSGGGWEELGAAVLGLGAGLFAALVTWLVLLGTVARGGTTPGGRAVGPPEGGALAVAARHVAVVVVLGAGGGVVAAAVEPWPGGPLAGGLLAAVAVGAALAAWGRAPRSARLRVVGVAAIAGLLVAGAVPDRAPYAWELQATATEALVAMLEEDPAAQRACTAGGAAGVPHASHVTGPCVEPDRVWTVARAPAATAELLAAEARRALGDAAAVHWDRRFEELVVTVDEDVVAVITHRAGCASRVVLDRYDPGGPGVETTCS